MEDDGQSSIVLKKYHKSHICLWEPAGGGEALIYLFAIKVTKIKMSILAWKQKQSFTAKLDEACLTKSGSTKDRRTIVLLRKCWESHFQANSASEIELTIFSSILVLYEGFCRTDREAKIAFCLSLNLTVFCNLHARAAGSVSIVSVNNSAFDSLAV